jgi:FMN-dependent NADH-azoreductase
MSELLHISASPRGPRSESLRIADVFVEAYREANPSADVEHWDLWDGSLPDFAVGARAKMTVIGGEEPVGAEHAAWQDVIGTFRRFDGADRLLFSVPMWNGSIPYVLKQLIDIVSQPGMVFGLDPVTGYEHMLEGRGKRVAVIYTSAVWGPGLGPEFGRDFQTPYFDDWLRWAGLSDISEIRFHPTLAGDYDVERRLADARAREVAKAFG